MFLFLVFFFFFFFFDEKVAWGEWFVHERVEHVCKEVEDAGLKHFTCFVKGWLRNLGTHHVEKRPNQT